MHVSEVKSNIKINRKEVRAATLTSKPLAHSHTLSKCCRRFAAKDNVPFAELQEILLISQVENICKKSGANAVDI